MDIGQVFASLLVVLIMVRLGQLLIHSGHAAAAPVTPES
jgi:hypothetical protein